MDKPPLMLKVTFWTALALLGFENHAVILARRFERDERAAAGEFAASAVEILPADFGELPVMRVAPQDFAGAVMPLHGELAIMAAGSSE